MRPLVWYLPAGLWAAGLLYLGSRDLGGLPATDLPLDKLAHFLLYGLLGVFAAIGWVGTGARPRAEWIVCAALLVGAADEMRQQRLSHRSAEVTDWVADALGVTAGFLAGVRLARTRRGRGGA